MKKIIIFGRDMDQKLQKNAIQTRHQNFQLFGVFFLKEDELSNLFSFCSKLNLQQNDAAHLSYVCLFLTIF